MFWFEKQENRVSDIAKLEKNKDIEEKEENLDKDAS